MTGIIDYGAGNIRSVINAFEYLGEKIALVSDPDTLAGFDRVVLPGVGAFGEAMAKLKATCMDEAILGFIASGRPFLGICLGMQLLFEKSYEFGEFDGLGVIRGKIIKFEENRFAAPLKIPHVGWNVCEFTRETPINKGLPRETYLYFVHSFHAVCEPEFALSRTRYGYDFTSAVAFGNVFGFQPHPEKSHENGLKILKNFTEL